MILLISVQEPVFLIAQMKMAFVLSLLSFQGSRSGHFSPSHSRGSGTDLPQSLRTDSKRPKGKAAKQRASEQPVFTHLSFVRACMKMWRYLYRNTANKWCESCALWSSLPVASITRIFLGKVPEINSGRLLMSAASVSPLGL